MNSQVETGPGASASKQIANLGVVIDKALLLVLFPFFTVLVIMGFVAIYTRNGRPVSVRLNGLGIQFELRSVDDAEAKEKEA